MTPLLLSLALASAGGVVQAPMFVRLDPVPFTRVAIEDRFWRPRRETNRTVSLRHSLQMLEKSGTLPNFDLAAKGAKEGFSGFVFQDSDAYKVLEACAMSLATHPDPDLDAQLDEAIRRVGAAQDRNGYLNTHFTVKEPNGRWKNLRDAHELYCAGHLFEAAVAHFNATGKRSLLDIAIKFADHIDGLFGDEPGQRKGYCGHPEIEVALVKLAKAAKRPAYFKLAEFFVRHRGEQFFADEHKTPRDKYDGKYWQDDVPIHEHNQIKGHAVRAAYLMAGVADIVRETEDGPMWQMLRRVWRNTTERNLYLTGGIGPSAHNEGFTVDYDLPNDTAYQETCASVAMVMWAHRMNLLTGESHYADAMERALYNGFLSGYSLSGTKYFYVNPLASSGSHHRQEWYSCACCPPNVARTLAGLGEYIYATSSDQLFVNLFVAGSGSARLRGADVSWHVETDYPWDGRVVMTLKSAGSFEVALRIPGWSQEMTAKVSGEDLRDNGQGYLSIRRTWKAGDKIVAEIPMPVQAVAAHPSVQGNRGRVAFTRGPIVFCAEQVDQSQPLEGYWVSADASFREVREPGVMGGVVSLVGPAKRSDSSWPSGLYRAASPSQAAELKLIPYCVWDNREAGPMQVWMPTFAPIPLLQGLEKSAEVNLSHVSSWCRPQGVKDGIEPKSSGEQPANNCHFWPRKGGTEWVEYRWKSPVRAASAQVYWFDDTGRGECRLPKSWRVTCLAEDGTWVPVKLRPGSSYSVKQDAWMEVEFEPVTAKALRLEIEQPEGWATGVHEWRIMAEEN